MIEKDKEFNKLNLYKKEILRKEIYSGSNIKKFSCCPHCGSKNFINFGKYNGIQRYQCKSCRKTFSNSTNSLWKYLKEPPEKWIKFIEFLLEKRTLAYCAANLEISMVTAFNWRHKILHGIEKLYIPKEFRDLIFMEMYYSRINYKGSKIQHFEFKNDFYKRYNIAETDVHTVISYDINDNIIIKKLGINKGCNRPLKSDLKEIFEKEVYRLCNEKSYIHIDPLRARPIYDDVIKHNKKVPIKIRKMYEFNPKTYVGIDNISDGSKESKIRVSLTKWLADFRGVATKYLNHYCNLFSLVFVDKPINYLKIFIDLSSEKCFYTSIKLMRLTHVEDY